MWLLILVACGEADTCKGVAGDIVPGARLLHEETYGWNHTEGISMYRADLEVLRDPAALEEWFPDERSAEVPTVDFAKFQAIGTETGYSFSGPDGVLLAGYTWSLLDPATIVAKFTQTTATGEHADDHNIVVDLWLTPIAEVTTCVTDLPWG